MQVKGIEMSFSDHTFSLLVVVSILFFPVFCQDLVYGDCSDVYTQDSDNCASNNCGSCFNPNGRSTTDDFDVVLCPSAEGGGNTGYYCNPEGGAFACMDWTFGSAKMMEQEEKFNQRV